MQNPFHASYWTQPDQFSARNHKRAPIHPTQSPLSWAIKKINKILRLSCHVGSNSANFVRFLINSRWWKLSSGLIVKTSCKNSILSEQNPSRALIKKEIKIQRRQILHLHWGLLALENAANVTGSPCRNIISKNPNSIYAVSHLKYFLAWDKRLFLLLIKTDHEINPRTSVCMPQVEVGQRWKTHQ